MGVVIYCSPGLRTRRQSFPSTPEVHENILRTRPQGGWFDQRSDQRFEIVRPQAMLLRELPLVPIARQQCPSHLRSIPPRRHPGAMFDRHRHLGRRCIGINTSSLGWTFAQRISPAALDSPMPSTGRYKNGSASHPPCLLEACRDGQTGAHIQCRFEVDPARKRGFQHPTRGLQRLLFHGGLLAHLSALHRSEHGRRLSREGLVPVLRRLATLHLPWGRQNTLEPTFRERSWDRRGIDARVPESRQLCRDRRLTTNVRSCRHRIPLQEGSLLPIPRGSPIIQIREEYYLGEVGFLIQAPRDPYRL